MKKFLPGILAIVMAFGLFAFTHKKPVTRPAGSTDVYYVFDPMATSADEQTKSKFTQVDDISELNCDGNNELCWILYADDVASTEPPFPAGSFVTRNIATQYDLRQ